jgi:predicted esterase
LIEQRLIMKIELILSGMLLSLVLCTGCESAREVDEQLDFDEVELKLNSLLEKEAYEEALAFVKDVSERFPDRDYELMAYRAELFARAGQYEKSLDIWEEGLRKGYFFGIHPQWDFFKPFEKYDRFHRIAAEDRRLREAADEKSKSVVKVRLPRRSLGEEKLPLFIALHGGGSSIEWAERYWKSRRLESEFIVAFIQSYLHNGMKSFGWRRHDPRARREIQGLFEDIVKQYPVDKERVIIGGMSAGGLMAVDVAINHVIPTAGFIGVCPGKPKEFDNSRVRAAREDGIKGVIIGGESDYYLPYQREMVHVFKEERFPHEFVIIPGMGHAYPKDFSYYLDQAIEFILRLKNGDYRQKYSSM